MFKSVEGPVDYRKGNRERKPVLYKVFGEFLATNPDHAKWFSAEGETKTKLRNAAKAHGISLAFATQDGKLVFKIRGPYRRRGHD